MNQEQQQTYEKEIKELLQVFDDEQELDSLENVVIRSYLSSNVGLDHDNIKPNRNTLKGWLECIDKHLPAGMTR